MFHRFSMAVDERVEPGAIGGVAERASEGAGHLMVPADTHTGTRTGTKAVVEPLQLVGQRLHHTDGTL